MKIAVCDDERVITNVKYFDIYYNTVSKETINSSYDGYWSEMYHNWIVTNETIADKCGDYIITHRVCSVCKCEEIDYER